MPLALGCVLIFSSRDMKPTQGHVEESLGAGGQTGWVIAGRTYIKTTKLPQTPEQRSAISAALYPLSFCEPVCVCCLPDSYLPQYIIVNTLHLHLE